MSGKGTPTTQPTAAGPSTTDDVVVSVNSLTVMSEGNSEASIKQEDNAVFLHNGHVGNAPLSEHVDAIMGNAQGSLDSSSLLPLLSSRCAVISWHALYRIAFYTAIYFRVWRMMDGAGAFFSL